MPHMVAGHRLAIRGLNHISRETGDVRRLAGFYREVLGFREVERPDFGFGGAWLQLPGGVQLHVIERDASKPDCRGTPPQSGWLPGDGWPFARGNEAPELRFFRRSHHLAFITGRGIEETRRHLLSHGVAFAAHAVPEGGLVQFFFRDPDWNAVEIVSADGGAKAATTDALMIEAIDHIARETADIPRMDRFYSEVLGFSPVRRPGNRRVDFQTSWFSLPGGVQLHLIESHPENPAGGAGLRDAELSSMGATPPKHIRRSHHIALTVEDVEETKRRLAAHGVAFATNAVPGTAITQLFFYDPDGNGIEVGNFDAGKSKL